MDETKNPWSVLSRATVYENEWIRVDHHEVLGPAGGPGVYGTVHFKNLATGVVPIDENGNVILVGQYRFPLRAYSWEIPEGGGAHSVSALESAQRELREECGLAAGCWKEILGMDLSNSVSDERARHFWRGNFPKRPRNRMKPKCCRLRACPSGMRLIASSEARSATRSASRLSFVLL